MLRYIHKIFYIFGVFMRATIRKNFVCSQEVAQHLEEMAKKIEADLILSNGKGFAGDGREVIATVALGKRMKL